MGWTMILKALLMMSVKQQLKQQVKQVSREEIYANALYLPVIYMLVATPTFLMIAGVVLFLVAGVAQFYPHYFFPTDLILALAAMSSGLSGGMFLVYRFVLKRLLMKEKGLDVLNTALSLEDKLNGILAPIRDQLRQEQDMFKHAFNERKNLTLEKK